MRSIAYSIFCLLDHFIWVLIQLVPGHLLMKIAKQRPWTRLRISLVPCARQRWKDRISWLLRRRCHRAGIGSSCLSRSLSGRLLLDIIGIDNELHLGMSRLSKEQKVPHAWLVEPTSGIMLTPGIKPGDGVPLTKL